VVRGLNRLGYSERKACALLGFARSTYYGIKFHRPSDRDIHQLLLEDAIKEIHTRSRGTYGRLRIKAALEIEQGLVVSVKVITKLMKRLEIHGLPGPRKFVRSHTNEATSTDLLDRSFVAAGPNEIWLTDITEHPTLEGRLFCCCVLDLFSRKVVGRSIDRHCDANLVNAALTRAGNERVTSSSTVIHSDHGSQFTSWAFTENVRRMGLISSMDSVGDCFDNAPMESFWGSMQIELLNRQRWRTIVELTGAIADWLENFYNSERRHSALNYLTPDEFEGLHSTQPNQVTLS
jgi:transposase InsO family protein